MIYDISRNNYFHEVQLKLFRTQKISHPWSHLLQSHSQFRHLCISLHPLRRNIFRFLLSNLHRKFDLQLLDIAQLDISSIWTPLELRDIKKYRYHNIICIEQVKTIKCWRANKLFHGIIIKPIISTNDWFYLKQRMQNSVYLNHFDNIYIGTYC